MCPDEQPVTVVVDHASSAGHDTIEVDLRAGAARVVQRGRAGDTVAELSLSAEDVAAWAALAAAVAPDDQARVVEDFFAMFDQRVVVRRPGGAAHPVVRVANPRGALPGAAGELVARAARLLSRAPRSGA